jgi:hypothetical protein
MKFLMIFLLLIPNFSYSNDNILTADMEDDEEYKPFVNRRSHWVINFAGEGLEYVLPFSFDGVKDFDEENRGLSGARLGLGREFYIPGGFLIGPRLDAYYLGTLFEKVKTAGAELNNEPVSGTKDSGSLYGVDAVMHLGWMFEYKTKNPFLNEMVNMAMELFVEGSVGKAQAWNKKRYYYDTTSYEGYRHTIADNIDSRSFGGGINLLSTTSGFFLQLKSMTTTFDITQRKETIFDTTTPSRNGTFKSHDVDIDPVTVYTFGGGYKF